MSDWILIRTAVVTALATTTQNINSVASWIVFPSIVSEGTVISEPSAIAELIKAKAGNAKRIGLETGPTTTWPPTPAPFGG